MPLDTAPRTERARLGRPTRSACRSATPRPASTSSSTRTWPPSSRMHAVEQGADLRGVTVLAFGGAGPVHACGVAELLESPRVIFPVNASVLSAFGTLVTPVRIDLARSMVRPLDAVDAAERDALLDELRAEGRRVLAAAGVADGPHPVPLRPRRPLPRPGQRDHDVGRRGRRVAGDRRRGRRAVRGGLPADLRPDDPRRRHRGRDVAPVGVRAGATPSSRRPSSATGDGERRTAPRRCASAAATHAVDTPVYRRPDLGVGQRIDGPGDRRGARDDGGHPPRLDGRRSPPTASLIAERSERDR